MLDIRNIKHGYWWDSEGKFKSIINKENKLLELTVQITDRCNMSCEKCNRVNFTSEDMKTKDIIRIINEACDLGLKHIHLTGGEPTLHSDLSYIVSTCKENGLKVDMSTNGKFSYETIKKVADSGIDSINISWDVIGLVPDCIGFIFDFKIDIFLNHMVMPNNFRQLPMFLDFIKINFPKIIDIQLMPPRGTAQKFNRRQLEEFNNKIAEESYSISKDRFPMVKEKVLTMLSFEFDPEKGIYHEKIEWPCHRSKSELRVGNKGFVTCTYLYRDGHITCGLENNVKEAWELCKKECSNIPPIKEMCNTSCSPEVSGFNFFIDEKNN